MQWWYPRPTKVVCEQKKDVGRKTYICEQKTQLFCKNWSTDIVVTKVNTMILQEPIHLSCGNKKWVLCNLHTLIFVRVSK